MLFFPVIASFFAFGALSAVASPAPVVQKRQDVSEVLSILDTLQSQTGSILPQIDNLINTDQATEENLTPLAQQLVAALNAGGSSLESLGAVEETGGTQEEVAQRTAAIYTDITKSLDNVKTKKPHFYPIFPKFGLEAALVKVLLGLGIVLKGVLKLVAALLKTVGGLLSGLGFLLVILTLGL